MENYITELQSGGFVFVNKCVEPAYQSNSCDQFKVNFSLIWIFLYYLPCIIDHHWIVLICYLNGAVFTKKLWHLFVYKLHIILFDSSLNHLFIFSFISFPPPMLESIMKNWISIIQKECWCNDVAFFEWWIFFHFHINNNEFYEKSRKKSD